MGENNCKCNLYCKYFHVHRGSKLFTTCGYYRKNLNNIAESITNNCKHYEYIENKKQ